MLCKAKTYYESLRGELFANVVRLIESANSVCSLLGHKMLQNLLDRNDNASYFASPRIFFGEMNYDIRIQKLNKEDKAFIKEHRKLIETSFLTCIRYHGKHRGIVETVYTSLALLTVEIKCGYTAAAVACVVMNMQEYVLSSNYKHGAYSSHRIHAMIMSILSLLCWVFDASIFYEYLYEVLKCRASVAPFLNPPIKYHYRYAEHNVLWNKKELFFEDWQVRYGIWNCFRPLSYCETIFKAK